MEERELNSEGARLYSVRNRLAASGTHLDRAAAAHLVELRALSRMAVGVDRGSDVPGGIKVLLTSISV